MTPARLVRPLALGFAAVVSVALLSIPAQAAPPPSGSTGQYLVVARTAADYAALRDSTARAGTEIVRELPEINTFVVKASSTTSSRVARDARVLGVVADQIRTIDSEERPPANLSAPGLRSAKQVSLPASARVAAPRVGINPDPAFDYRGLLWNYRRIGLPEGWQTTAGRPAVTVGVADTGLDFTHTDLRPNEIGRAHG